MRRSILLPTLLAAATLLGAPPGTTAQEAAAGDENRMTVNRLLDMEGVSNPQISPDGTRILFGRSHVNRMEDRQASEVWIMEADGSRKRFLVEGSSPRWSPDGTRIAYTAPGDEGGSQVFVRWMDAEGSTSQVTRTEHAPQNLKWSPDGEHLAFTMFSP
ncbi:MAG TPA: hypothetical protein VLL48_07615, partial [Longimicrobiales bacterium]|nr:hypothetical protein [Longimicrobiales bacterium]